MKILPGMTFMLVALFILWPQLTDAQTPIRTATVERIVDGDGLYIKGEKRQIRLFGVDAPERDEDGFTEATEALRAMVEEQEVRVIYLYPDRFGRIVGRVFVGDVEVNAALIHQGPAVEFCRYSEGFYKTCLTS